MTQQKSEDRVVPDGEVLLVEPVVDGQGKAVPVDEEVRELSLVIATAEHHLGVPDRSGMGRVVKPKAIGNAQSWMPVTMEEVAHRLMDALVKGPEQGSARPGRTDGQSTATAVVDHWSGAGPKSVGWELSPGGNSPREYPEGGWWGARVGNPERDRSRGV
jgi:hypothetical protein